jgi:protoporphyrinogen oxidase
VNPIGTRPVQNGAIVVLGAGISGLTAACELASQHGRSVVVIEAEPTVGGTAKTFREEGVCFDFGSHRLHEGVSLGIRDYIERVIGEPLLWRPRQGRLYCHGQFIRYPPTLSTLLQDLSWTRLGRFAGGLAANLLLSPRRPRRTLEDVLLRRVGPGLYRDFFLGYAQKLWGKEPVELAADALKQRAVLFNPESFKRFVWRGPSGFYYPPRGIGQIAEGLTARIVQRGGTVACRTRVKRITTDRHQVKRLVVEGPEGRQSEIDVHLLVSTIAPDELAAIVCPHRSPARQLEWRGLRVLCLELEGYPTPPADTYYFPNADMILGRVSETRRFSPHLNHQLPGTLLTIEIPRSSGDLLEKMPDDELGRLCFQDLVKARVIAERARVRRVLSRQLDKAYPVYALGWRSRWEGIRAELRPFTNLFSIGKRALFLQCNIDHCMIQALRLAELIKSDRWQEPGLWDRVSQPFGLMQARD